MTTYSTPATRETWLQGGDENKNTLVFVDLGKIIGTLPTIARNYDDKTISEFSDSWIERSMLPAGVLLTAEGREIFLCDSNGYTYESIPQLNPSERAELEALAGHAFISNEQAQLFRVRQVQAAAVENMLKENTLHVQENKTHD